MKLSIIASSLFFAGTALFGFGPSNAAALPMTPSRVAPAGIEEVQKVHAWHCGSAFQRNRGWHRHPGACGRGRGPGITLQFGNRNWGNSGRGNRGWDGRGRRYR